VHSSAGISPGASQKILRTTSVLTVIFLLRLQFRPFSNLKI